MDLCENFFNDQREGGICDYGLTPQLAARCSVCVQSPQSLVAMVEVSSSTRKAAHPPRPIVATDGARVLCDAGGGLGWRWVR